LAAVQNSLCPNASANYQIMNNGIVVAEGSLSAGQPALVTGQVGDIIDVNVMIGAGDPSIVCITQGQTMFSLGHVHWQQ